jgi:hypothetical protein
LALVTPARSAGPLAESALLASVYKRLFQQARSKALALEKIASRSPVGSRAEYTNLDCAGVEGAILLATSDAWWQADAIAARIVHSGCDFRVVEWMCRSVCGTEVAPAVVRFLRRCAARGASAEPPAAPPPAAAAGALVRHLIHVEATLAMQAKQRAKQSAAVPAVITSMAMVMSGAPGVVWRVFGALGE